MEKFLLTLLPCQNWSVTSSQDYFFKNNNKTLCEQETVHWNMPSTDLHSCSPHINPMLSVFSDTLRDLLPFYQPKGFIYRYAHTQTIPLRGIFSVSIVRTIGLRLKHPHLLFLREKRCRFKFHIFPTSKNTLI